MSIFWLKVLDLMDDSLSKPPSQTIELSVVAQHIHYKSKGNRGKEEHISCR